MLPDVAMSEGQVVLDQSDGDFNLLREKREVYFQEEWMRICNLRSFIVAVFSLNLL